MIYPDPETVAAVGEDPQSADIPELHKAVFRWLETFVKSSDSTSERDIEELRQLGASDEEIAEWVNIASLQIYLVSIADSSGVPLESEVAETESALAEFSSLHRDRSYYHVRQPDTPQTKTTGTANPTGGQDGAKLQSSGWLSAPCAGDDYEKAARDAEARYGVIPNLFKAISASGRFYKRHQMVLDLLEHPQTDTLSGPLHALVRAATIALDRCDYFAATADSLLARTCDSNIKYSQLVPDPLATARTEQERVVLAFAEKLIRTPYKITAKDAQDFRDAGLDDKAYVDVFNTVSLQCSLDRLANATGVAADSRPLLSAQLAS